MCMAWSPLNLFPGKYHTVYMCSNKNGNKKRIIYPLVTFSKSTVVV